MIAFIHIPKAAGSTLATILRRSFRTQHCDVRCGNSHLYRPKLTAETLGRIRWIYWRLVSIRGHGVVPHSDLHDVVPNIRFYTILRDPIHRSASEYQYRVSRGSLDIPFEKWIQTDIARNRMTQMLAGKPDADAAIEMLAKRVSFVGLVERFDESLVMWRRWLDDPRSDIRYRATNVMTENVIKRQLLTDSTSRAQLEEANREDLKLYHYVANNVYPQQVQQYGSTLATDVQRFQSTNYPGKIFPGQLASLALRKLVYRPLAHRIAGVHRDGTRRRPAA